MQGELKSDSIKISRLRTKILEGEIKIPPFQREFIWPLKHQTPVW